MTKVLKMLQNFEIYQFYALGEVATGREEAKYLMAPNATGK